MAQRYVKIPVLVLPDGTKIAVDKLKFKEHEDFPDEYIFGDSWRNTTSQELTELIWDIKNRKFVDSEIINYYPPLEYVIGKEYLIEQDRGHNQLKRELLKEIRFDNYDCSYKKYKDLESYYAGLLTTEQKQKLIPSSLVEIRTYNPTYVFESGYETEWSFKFHVEV